MVIPWKSVTMYSIVALVCAAILFFPELAFAQDGGGAVRAKLDNARESYAVPIAIGIIAVGAVIAIILWLFDVIDWKGMAKWIFGAILVSVIAGVVLELAA